MTTLLAHGDVPPFFVLFAAIVGVLITVIHKHHEGGGRRRRWEDFASRVQGTYTPGGVFRDDTVNFTLRGCPAVLESRGGRHPFSTLHVAAPRSAGGTLHIVRDRVLDSLLRPVHGPRHRIGDRVFDEEYSVRGGREALARKLFAPEQRAEAMRTVRRLNHCAGAAIHIEGYDVCVRIEEDWMSLDVALAMVRTAEDVLRLLFEVDVDRRIQVDALVETGAGCCPVCTTALREPIVRCGRCRSPHHRDCWDYAGRCATYGCERKAA